VTGEITCTPDANFHGSDSFTYTVRDDQGAESCAATVVFTVTAVNDPPNAAELFQRRGKGLYEQVHLTTLLDSQATKAGIQQALKRVGALTRPQDTLVLFLAGHGSMIGQRYYFIPQEFHKQTERQEDDIRQQGLPADEL
jgi:hypothetical protein